MSALLLAFEPALLRGARRFGCASDLRLDTRLLDELRQSFECVAPVLLLRAEALRADDDHVVIGEASTGECAQPLPHTLGPDRLQQSKKKPAFETVGEKKVMTDGNHVIEIHHVRGNGHNEGLLVAYLPKEKILIEADAYNPPAQPPAAAPPTVSPYTANLAETISRLKLDVQRIIPIHYPADSRNVGFDEFKRMSGQGN